MKIVIDRYGQTFPARVGVAHPCVEMTIEDCDGGIRASAVIWSSPVDVETCQMCFAEGFRDFPSLAAALRDMRDTIIFDISTAAEFDLWYGDIRTASDAETWTTNLSRAFERLDTETDHD